MNNNSNKIIIYRKEKKNVQRQNCECACVLCTNGLMSHLQMYSTWVCYVLFGWDMAWGEKLFFCLVVLVLSDL